MSKKETLFKLKIQHFQINLMNFMNNTKNYKKK